MSPHRWHDGLPRPNAIKPLSLPAEKIALLKDRLAHGYTRRSRRSRRLILRRVSYRIAAQRHDSSSVALERDEVLVADSIRRRTLGGFQQFANAIFSLSTM